MNSDEAKRAAAEAAIDECVQSGQKLGMGTGSTANFAIDHLARRLKDGSLKDVLVVVTSFGSLTRCQELGIPVFSLNDSRIEGHLDLALDGADEVNPLNQLIKGGGGAHLLEKIVEYNSDRLYVMVDESKLVDGLGTGFPIPVEVIPEARLAVARRVKELGFSFELRMARAKVGPVITDSGNQILDIRSSEVLAPGTGLDPAALEKELNSIPGVVENGLFTRPVDAVFIGTADGVQIRRP